MHSPDSRARSSKRKSWFLFVLLLAATLAACSNTASTPPTTRPEASDSGWVKDTVQQLNIFLPDGNSDYYLNGFGTKDGARTILSGEVPTARVLVVHGVPDPGRRSRRPRPRFGHCPDEWPLHRHDLGELQWHQGDVSGHIEGRAIRDGGPAALRSGRPRRSRHRRSPPADHHLYEPIRCSDFADPGRRQLTRWKRRWTPTGVSTVHCQRLLPAATHRRHRCQHRSSTLHRKAGSLRVSESSTIRTISTITSGSPRREGIS